MILARGHSPLACPQASRPLCSSSWACGSCAGAGSCRQDSSWCASPSHSRSKQDEADPVTARSCCPRSSCTVSASACCKIPYSALSRRTITVRVGRSTTTTATLPEAAFMLLQRATESLRPSQLASFRYYPFSRSLSTIILAGQPVTSLIASLSPGCIFWRDLLARNLAASRSRGSEGGRRCTFPSWP